MGVHPSSPSMYAAVATDETTASTTYVDLATVRTFGNSAEAGDYEVISVRRCGTRMAARTCYAAVKRGAPQHRTTTATATNVTTAAGMSVSRKIVVTGLAASDVLKLQHRVTAGTGKISVGCCATSSSELRRLPVAVTTSRAGEFFFLGW